MTDDQTPAQGIPRPSDELRLQACEEGVGDLTDIVGSHDRKLEELRIHVANLNAMVEGHHGDIEQMSRQLRGSEPQMTPDRMIELSDVIFNAAEVLMASIPLGTREQWSAADCLRTSATHLYSAAMWLRRDDER